MHQVRKYLGVVFLRPARDHLAGGRRPVVEDLRVHKPRLKRQQVSHGLEMTENNSCKQIF